MSTSNNYVNKTQAVLRIEEAHAMLQQVAPRLCPAEWQHCYNRQSKKISSRPLFTITTYQAMDINGYMFYTMAQDAKSVYQNSGVLVRAVDNKNNTTTYYG
jgi:hypothetical protein